MKKELGMLLLIFAIGIIIFPVIILADTATGNVVIIASENNAPAIGTVTLWNQAGADAAITLTPGSTITIKANATITDLDGGVDISYANSTLYHTSSISEEVDDENKHITNSSCELGEAVGNTKVVTCAFTMNFMASAGTWTVNITAEDGSAASASASDANTVNSLAGLDITEGTIDMGSLSLGENSSSAATMTIRNQGNVEIGAIASGTNYNCTSGSIPVNNTRYSTTTGSYDEMSTSLSEVETTVESFSIGTRGIVTSNGEDSEDSLYWTIKIPDSSISGNCTNTIIVTAIEA